MFDRNSIYFPFVNARQGSRVSHLIASFESMYESSSDEEEIFDGLVSPLSTESLVSPDLLSAIREENTERDPYSWFVAVFFHSY